MKNKSLRASRKMSWPHNHIANGHQGKYLGHRITLPNCHYTEIYAMKFLTFARWPGIYVALIHHGKSISWFSRHNILWWKRAISSRASYRLIFFIHLYCYLLHMNIQKELLLNSENNIWCITSSSSFNFRTPSSYWRLCAVHAWGKKNHDNVQINVITIYSGAVWLKLCTVDW